jgi:ADP-heptose:LPS heptosyltransferase
MTTKVYYNPYRHMTEVFLALARSVGADTDDLSLVKIKMPPGDKEQLDGILDSNGFQKGLPLVVLNVNAGELSIERRWPKEHFAELAKRLLRKFEIQVVFIGIDEDRPYVQEVLKEIDEKERILNLSGVLSLQQLFALFERSVLLITNDGGPLHLASLVGTPTIALFGPESPTLYAPVGSEIVIFYKDLYCSPCLSVYNSKTTECTNNRCMQSISVDEVYESTTEKIEGILQRTA